MNLPEPWATLDEWTLYAGAVLCLGYVVWLAAQKRNPLRGCPLRPSRLGFDVMAGLVAFYLFLGMAAQMAWTSWSLKAADEHASTLRNAVLGPLISLIAGVSCLVVGKHYFRAGLRGLGLGRRPLWRDIGLATFMLFASLPLVYVFHDASVWLLRHLDSSFQPPDHNVVELLREAEASTSIRIWLTIGAVVIAPFAEEVFFRGIVQTTARKLLGSRWAGLGLASILFGFIHLAQPQAVLPLVWLGFVLGYTYERTGSLLCPMFVHALFNGRTLLYQAALTSNG